MPRRLMLPAACSRVTLSPPIKCSCTGCAKISLKIMSGTEWLCAPRDTHADAGTGGAGRSTRPRHDSAGLGADVTVIDMNRLTLRSPPCDVRLSGAVRRLWQLSCRSE
jgi:hypothetical protein